MTDLEPPYGDIWDLFKVGKIIPFLGAGASQRAVSPRPVDEKPSPRLPTGAELGQYLADKVTFPPGEPTGDLPKVAQYYCVVMGRPRLRERLREVFVQDFPHLSIHEFLADVPANLLIVTTNYDELLERAFQARQRDYHLVIHPTDSKEWAASVIHWKPHAKEPEFVAARKLRFDLDDAPVIYKMHGTVDRQDARRDSFVITEDDYADFIVRVAKGNAIPALFAEPLKTRYLLYLGYSLRDWNFRVILSRIKHDPLFKGKEFASWAIQYNPSPLEQALWDKRGVTIYSLTIEEFVRKLRERMKPQ